MPPEWTASGCLRRRQPLACASSCAVLRRKQRSLTLPTPEGGGFSGYARPNGPRWRLTGLPGPTARGAASEEAASTEPCTQRRAHNGETALSPCLQAGACAPTEKVSEELTPHGPIALWRTFDAGTTWMRSDAPEIANSI